MSPALPKVLKRLALLAVVGLVVSQMLPSLADQLTPNPVVESTSGESQPEVSPSPSETASPAASSSPSSSPVAEITYLESESPTAKAKIIESDSLFFRTPVSLHVDPRAKSVRMDSFALGGAENILVCVISNRANISLANSRDVLIEGQGTHSLSVSGSAPSVLAALTAGQGITVASASRISEASLTFQVSAVNKPSADPGLCSPSQITRFVSISALGVDLGIVKAPVQLGKK